MQKTFKQVYIYGIIIGLCSGSTAWSRGPASVTSGTGLNDQYDYPELSVVPRASDRLQSEAKLEAGGTAWDYLPLQLSAVSTVLAGALSFEAANPGYGIVGMATGGVWLASTLLLSMSYHPYQASLSQLASLPKGGGTREQLTRERAAEEAIKRAAAAGSRLKWLSTVTNLGASIFMLSKGNSTNNTTNYAAFGAQMASAVLAFTPMIYGFHWSDVQDEQMEYKKRIYSPVASATFFVEPTTREILPGMALSLRF